MKHSIFAVLAAAVVATLCGAAHAAGVGDHSAALAMAAPPVPEPGTLGILGLGAMMLLRRRR